RSAGASPGPLCYDLGGTEPTVTDANVVLGYLNPTALAGGAVKLNAARSHEIFQERVAKPLGLPLAEAAYGAHLIAASNMMRAIRAVSSERGRDPREYALFAFGRKAPAFGRRPGRGVRDARGPRPARPGALLGLRSALPRGRAPLRPHVAPAGARSRSRRAGRGLRTSGGRGARPARRRGIH